MEKIDQVLRSAKKRLEGFSQWMEKNSKSASDEDWKKETDEIQKICNEVISRCRSSQDWVEKSTQQGMLAAIKSVQERDITKALNILPSLGEILQNVEGKVRDYRKIQEVTSSEPGGNE